jgi:hypothetical protein
MYRERRKRQRGERDRDIGYRDAAPNVMCAVN